MRTGLFLGLLLLAAACSKRPEAPDRARVRRTGGHTFELVPAEGQLPYCLAYTVSKSTGVTRQLTMSRKNVSFECPAGAPVGKRPFRVPEADGEVRVFVLFTSQPVNAGSIAQQILDAPDRLKLNAMDMRLPGNAAFEAHDFVPEADVAPEVGGVLGEDAGVEAPDAGAAETAAGADAGPR